MRIFEYWYTCKISKGGEGMKESIFRTMGRLFSVLTVMLLVAAGTSSGSGKPGLLGHDIWEIKGEKDKITWVVIHNPDGARKSGIVHIEVIARKKGAPEWSVEHVCNHMAITEEALSKSVIRPLKTGKVYPESFDSAYSEWQEQAGKGNKVVCTTSLAECLKMK